jgi:hypothetical protein
MTSDQDLSPGERMLRSWPARTLGNATSGPASGSLVLTNRRLLFLPKSGLFGRSRPAATNRSAPLEEIGGALPHRSEMRIGYGDKMILEGIEVSGVVYELGREAPTRAILTEIALARQLRRKELGLPEDIAPCHSCGRWIPSGTRLCASCARSQKTSP